MQQQQIPPTTPFSVILVAHQWSTILEMLDNAPRKVANPIYNSIMTQIQMSAAPEPANGAAPQHVEADPA